MESAMPSLYRCSKCDSHKELLDFPPSKAHNSGQWCRQCLREDQRRIKGLTASERTVSCAQCGAPFATTFTKAMFCSRECKTTAHNAAMAAERIASKPARSCVHCSKPLPSTMRSDAKFCSEGCNSAAHAITRKMAKRAGTVRHSTDPLFERNYIARRDNYRCGLCGSKVDMKRSYPDPLFGSIDHILPLAAGGTNDLANLQLTHLRCNLKKRDRGVAQLRLLG